MKKLNHVKLFENFSDDFSTEERNVIADAVKSRDLAMSSDYDEILTSGFEVDVSSWEGKVDEDEVDQKILDEIAKQIESGKDSGVVEGDEINYDWSLKKE